VASLTFFFDRCTGTRLPKLIVAAKPPFAVEYHDDPKHGFTDTTPDDEWLGVVCSNKWVVISHDKRFHQDGLAVASVKQHGGKVFYLFGGSLPTWDKLRVFAQAYIRMRDIARREKPPFIYRVTASNRVLQVKLL